MYTTFQMTIKSHTDATWQNSFRDKYKLMAINLMHVPYTHTHEHISAQIPVLFWLIDWKYRVQKIIAQNIVNASSLHYNVCMAFLRNKHVWNGLNWRCPLGVRLVWILNRWELLGSLSAWESGAVHWMDVIWYGVI